MVKVTEPAEWHKLQTVVTWGGEMRDLPSPTYPIGRTPSSATLGEACKSGPYRAPQQAPEKINLLRFTASSAKPRLQGSSPPSLPLSVARNIRPSISPQFPYYSFTARPSSSSHWILVRDLPLAVMSLPPNVLFCVLAGFVCRVNLVLYKRSQ